MQTVKRSMRYATAGVHQNNSGMMNVRWTVSLPDADAGRERDEENRRAYVHQGPVPSSRRVWRVPLSWALLFLGALTLVFVVKIGTRLSARANESRQIASMEQAIINTIRENQELTLEIAKCRDSSRICYRAVQELGMMSSAAVEAVPVVAPDTRPFEHFSVSASAGSPSALGLSSGSR